MHLFAPEDFPRAEQYAEAGLPALCLRASERRGTLVCDDPERLAGVVVELGGARGFSQGGRNGSLWGAELEGEPLARAIRACLPLPLPDVALAVRQPWASLLVNYRPDCAVLNRLKNVENRDWRLPRRYWGRRALILASRKPAFETRSASYMCPWLDGEVFDLLDVLPGRESGGIVGMVEFDADQPNDGDICFEGDSCSPWGESAAHHWRITRAWTLPFLPVRGQLGFFPVDYRVRGLGEEVGGWVREIIGGGEGVTTLRLSRAVAAGPEIIIDLFAGGGGASQGIFEALGRHPDVAVNHDRLAVAMHGANHPTTEHHCQDVWTCDPLEAARGRPVGLLHASPDCTQHSRAKGGRPVRDKQLRELAWAVFKWVKLLRPRVLTLENVMEFMAWGPEDEAGNIIKARRGETFKAFVAALRETGYKVQWRMLKACDFGAPTSRERLFMVARRDGRPIRWPEPTHGPGRAHPWRTAAEAIDFCLPCYSIFLTREEVKAQGLPCRRPLRPKTMARIARGVLRYVVQHADPFIVTWYGPKRRDVEFRGQSLSDPLDTITAAGNRFGLVAPTLIQTGYGEREGQAPRAPGQVRAFLMAYYGEGCGQDARNPMRTLTAKDRMGLVMVQGEPHLLADICMRMLEPKELYLAQGFPAGYVFERTADGKRLTKGQQVHMVGNSVSPPVEAALIRANCLDMARARVVGEGARA